METGARYPEKSMSRLKSVTKTIMSVLADLMSAANTMVKLAAVSVNTHVTNTNSMNEVASAFRPTHAYRAAPERPSEVRSEVRSEVKLRAHCVTSEDGL